MADRPDLSPLATSEAAQPKQLYHAAPVAIHDSVLEHGLDPARFPRERWDASDLGVWCFETLSRAFDYAQSRSFGPLAEPYEAWEVQVEGLEMTRPWCDPDSDLPAGVDVWCQPGSSHPNVRAPSRYRHRRGSNSSADVTP